MDKNSKKYKIFKVVLVIVTTVFWTVGITEMSKEFLNEQLNGNSRTQSTDDPYGPDGQKTENIDFVNKYTTSSIFFIIFKIFVLLLGWVVCLVHLYLLIYKVGYDMVFKRVEEDSETDRMVV